MTTTSLNADQKAILKDIYSCKIISKRFSYSVKCYTWSGLPFYRDSSWNGDGSEMSLCSIKVNLPYDLSFYSIKEIFLGCYLKNATLGHTIPEHMHGRKYEIDIYVR